MNGRPTLVAVARVLREQGLEAVLIGNAAAALHGAPVTTLDFDFFFLKTATNLKKLRAVAKALGAVMFTPHYPVSGLIRLMRDEDALQLDFISTIHGARSFNSVRGRAKAVKIDAETLLVAALADIIASKRSADRPRDRSVLDGLEATLKEIAPEAGSGSAEKGK